MNLIKVSTAYAVTLPVLSGFQIPSLECNVRIP